MTTATINTNLCEVLNLAIETFPEPEKWGTGSLLHEGRYCALGWIGHCMGYDDTTLAYAPDYDKLFRPLGFEPQDYMAIYGANDQYGRDGALRAIYRILAKKGC